MPALRFLLLCGILSLVMYAVADVIVGMSLAAYSFRVYTAATIILMLAFGLWSGLDAPKVEAGCRAFEGRT